MIYEDREDATFILIIILFLNVMYNSNGQNIIPFKVNKYTKQVDLAILLRIRLIIAVVGLDFLTLQQQF